MSKNSDTRSSLLWEVERILKETKCLPQILLMENVVQVSSGKNLPDFKQWLLFLEELGYSNYFQNLVAKDYGIPQKRNRTYMVSILGNYYYQFPKKIPLQSRLKDLLEDDVDKKFYLSDKMFKHFTSMVNRNGFIRNRAFRPHNKDNANIAFTITTRAGERVFDNFIYLGDGKYRKLTTKECWRLMGFSDEDYEKANRVCSNSQLIRQAGNSIVVNVLEAIFKELL